MAGDCAASSASAHTGPQTYYANGHAGSPGGGQCFSQGAAWGVGDPTANAGQMALGSWTDYHQSMQWGYMPMQQVLQANGQCSGPYSGAPDWEPTLPPQAAGTADGQGGHGGASASSSGGRGGPRWGRDYRKVATPTEGQGGQQTQQAPATASSPSSAAADGREAGAAGGGKASGRGLGREVQPAQNSAAAVASEMAAAGSNGKTGGGGRRSRANPRWGEGLTRPVKISKTLTQVLRHRAQDLGIPIRPDGFCKVDDVLSLKWLQELQCTLQDVEEVVKDSDKKRFEIVDDGSGVMLIRAVQGHSIKLVDDEKLLQRLELDSPNIPKCCVHGTYRRHFDSIKAKGLLAGGGQGQGFRNHVHFAPFEPGDKRVISGMRYDCEIAIWIDMQKAITDGVPFYMSANKVILSPGIDGIIDKKYFMKAKDLTTGQELPISLWNGFDGKSST